MNSRRSSSKHAPKMDSIDETSVLESTTIATAESPSRSIKTTSSSSSSSDQQFASVDALHHQLQMIEEAETANTLSRAAHLQEQVLENPNKPVPPAIFKYILIGMGLCGVLIGIVLGAIIGRHLLKQHPRYNMQPPPFSNITLSSQAPSPSAPNLIWYYPPTPTPSSDIFHHPTPSIRTAHPTMVPSHDANATSMPTTIDSTNSSSTFQNETLSFNESSSNPSNGTEEDSGALVNNTYDFLP